MTIRNIINCLMHSVFFLLFFVMALFTIYSPWYVFYPVMLTFGFVFNTWHEWAYIERSEIVLNPVKEKENEH